MKNVKDVSEFEVRRELKLTRAVTYKKFGKYGVKGEVFWREKYGQLILM